MPFYYNYSLMCLSCIYNFSSTYCIENNVIYKGTINGFSIGANINSGTAGYLAYYGNSTTIKGAGTTDALKIGNQNLLFNAGGDGIYLNANAISYHDTNNTYKKTPIYFKKMDDNYTNVFVGINNSSPNYQLDVSGDIRSSNTLRGTNILVSNAGAAYIRCENNNHHNSGSTTNLQVMLHSAVGGNHGVYSSGYWNGSTFTSDAKWIVYRGTDGSIILNGNATSATSATTASKLGSSTLGATNKPIYLNAGTPTECGVFAPLGSTGETAITDNSDLNEYTTIGVYGTSGGYVGSSTAVSLSNKPTFAGGFRMYVESCGGDGSYVRQTIITKAGLTFVRTSISLSASPKTWTDWKQIATTSDIPSVPSWSLASSKPSYTLDEVSDGSTRKLANYLPLAGGTMTGNLVFKGTAGISFQGTKSTYKLIDFIDNANDAYGNGIIIGGGGAVVIGAGESASTFKTKMSLNGGTETMYITSDGAIEFYPNMNNESTSNGTTFSYAKKSYFDSNGNLYVNNNVYAATKQVATQEWVTDKGYTTNTGTITKVGNTTSGNVSVSSNNNTASWDSAVVVGSVGGVDLKFTMPSNPNTNTTYSLSRDGANVKLTPSSGTAQSVSLSDLINGLGVGTSNAEADDYLVAQYAGGGTTTTSYYRRKVSAVVNASRVKAALGTGSGTTKFLREDGTWQTPAYPTTLPANGGTAENVSGVVAIANGGTGASTRLNALKALTNENVGANATYFLTITDSWGKGGYSSVANVKSVLGLKSAAYTESSAYATAEHTHSQYLTSETSLSKGTTSGTGNAVTDISVNGHTITLIKDSTFLTSETSLSKGTTTGTGNAITDISVNGHTINLTKGSTFLTSVPAASSSTRGGAKIYASGDILYISTQ